MDRGRTKKDILYQINQRKEDFIKYVLPQNKYADISMTTISRGLENVSFDIYIKTQYFFELQHLLNLITGANITEISNESTFTHFQLMVDKDQHKEIFSLLTNDINNLKNHDFDLENYGGDNLIELTVKLSMALFLLNKKLENRL